MLCLKNLYIFGGMHYCTWRAIKTRDMLLLRNGVYQARFSSRIFVSWPQFIYTVYVSSYDRSESMFKLHDIVRYMFLLVYLDNQLIRMVETRGREAQTCLKCHWPINRPPINIPPILYINAWFVTKFRWVFQLVWFSYSSQLSSLGRSQSSVHWSSVSVR